MLGVYLAIPKIFPVLEMLHVYLRILPLNLRAFQQDSWKASVRRHQNQIILPVTIEQWKT